MAVMNGLVSQDFYPDFSCPSAECRWPQIDTLAVCSHCVDVSATSNVSCQAGAIRGSKFCNYTTPNGFSFEKALLSLPGVPPFHDDVYFDGQGSTFDNGKLEGNLPALARLSLFKTDQSLSNFTMVDCSPTLCVKVLHDTRVNNGSLRTSSFDELSIFLSAGDSWQDPPISSTRRAVPVSSVRHYDVFTVTDQNYTGNRSFTVNVLDLHTLGQYLADTFTVSQGNDSMGVREILWQASSISDKIQNVSLSLTNTFGVARRAQTGNNGEVYGYEAYVHVRWAWGILPLLVVLMANAFLVASMIQSRSHKTRPWKNSIYPLLFSKFEGVDQVDAVATEVDDLERVAKSIQASLAVNGVDDGIRFVRS